MSPTILRKDGFRFFFYARETNEPSHVDMSSLTESNRATTVRISAGRLEVELADGRKVIVPLTWFPRLDDADEAELRNWRLIGKGEGIRWPDLDEDVSVFSLLYPEKTIPSREIRQRQE